jgi:hypothetical protein
MRTTTNVVSSSTKSVIFANNFPTNFPDSENHLENSEWELISTSLECAYLVAFMGNGLMRGEFEKDAHECKLRFTMPSIDIPAGESYREFLCQSY